MVCPLESRYVLPGIRLLPLTLNAESDCVSVVTLPVEVVDGFVESTVLELAGFGTMLFYILPNNVAKLLENAASPTMLPMLTSTAISVYSASECPCLLMS
jgi:hypothetical protein